MTRYQGKKYGVVVCLLGICCIIGGCVPVEEPPELPPQTPQRTPQQQWEDQRRERLTAEWAYQEGLQRFDRGEYENAIRYFQLAIERDRRHLRAYLSLGDVYSMQNNYLVAETYYNKVLNYDPQSVPAYTALANMHRKMGNYREALSVYHKVLEIDPANQFAQQQIEITTRELFNLYYEQGLAYKEAGELSLAATEFQKASSLYPENIQFAVEIGYLFLEQQDYIMANRYFQQALSVEPDYLPAIVGIGKVQLALKNYDEAIDYFEQGSNLQPGEQETDELLQDARAEKVRATLSQEYWSIVTSEQVTRGDIAALLIVDLMLESRLESPSRLAIISDITTHWAKPYIIKAVQYDIMGLPPDRDFRPNEPIRKGELAFVLDTLFRKLSMPLSDGGMVSFSDVHPDNEYHDAVLRVYSAGLMDASAEDTFGVLDTVSGEKAIQIFEEVKLMIR